MSFLQFLIWVFLISILWMTWSLRDIEDISEYFKTLTGKQILSGIIRFMSFFVAFGTLSLLFGCADMTYLNDASIYAGLEYTDGPNQMCESGGADDRTVSNGGARLNLIRSFDQSFDLDFATRHHSCAFNADNLVYDSWFGLEAEKKIWIKNKRVY